MASTTGPDLTAARDAVERLQDDACVVTRTSGAAVLNQSTGKMEYPAATTVYSAATLGDYGRSLADAQSLGGRCSITQNSGGRSQYREEGGRQVLDSTPQARLPVDAPLILEGDILTVTSSRRDPQLVGQVFRVSDVIESSYAISRRLVLEMA